MNVSCKVCKEDFSVSPVVSWVGSEFILAKSPITVLEVVGNEVQYTCNKCQDKVEFIVAQTNLRRKYVRASS